MYSPKIFTYTKTTQYRFLPIKIIKIVQIANISK